MSPTGSRQARIPALDGIRGLAISLVLFQHYVYDSTSLGTNKLGDFVRHNLTLGGTGVDLFFVLSGFLIGGILMDNRGGENYFKSFYIRRLCRIIPLYYLCLLGYVLSRAVLGSNSGQHWFDRLFVSGVSLWPYLTFTQNLFLVIKYGTGVIWAAWISPTWSLNIEEQFYLILPLAVWLARPSWILPACLACICTHFASYYWLWLYHPVAYWHISMVVPFRADALLLGVVCAGLVRQEKSSRWFSENRHVLYTLLIVFLLGTGFIAPRFYSSNYEIERDTFFYLWLALLYACLLLLAVIQKDGLVSRFVCFTPLRKLGIIAYGVFLFHQPINGLLH